MTSIDQVEALPTSHALAVGGAIECFLKIDGVDGESTDDRHRGEIDVVGFTFGASNPMVVGAGSGAAVGKVRFQDLHVVKKVDKASVRLFVACATGQHIRTATLTCRRAGGSPFEFLTVIVEDVVVTALVDSGSAVAGNAPTEDVSFVFGRIKLTYTPQKPDGSADAAVTGGWDVRTNMRV